MRKIAFLLPLLFFVFLQPQVQAQMQSNSSESATVTPTPQQQVQYTLPYPGLLPDNPLYNVKVLRDRIVSFFISDPLRKSQFNLLQADKRLNSAYYLAKEKGKDTLVITTLSKGENYFEQSVGNVKEAKSQGEDVGAQLGRMQDSAKEHEWVITQMEMSANANTKQQLEKELQRVKNFEKTVGEIATK